MAVKKGQRDKGTESDLRMPVGVERGGTGTPALPRRCFFDRQPNAAGGGPFDLQAGRRR